MAHRKAGGSTDLGRDSISKRLGVKAFGSEKVRAGEIIIRQRGTKFHPGVSVRRGADDTLYAAVDGVVRFEKRKVISFTGALVRRTFVHLDAPGTVKPAKAKKKVLPKKSSSKSLPAKKPVAKKGAPSIKKTLAAPAKKKSTSKKK